MEQWEKDLREKLEKEVEHGVYYLSTGDFTLATGKGGKIIFEVELERELRRLQQINKDNLDEKELL